MTTELKAVAAACNQAADAIYNGNGNLANIRATLVQASYTLDRVDTRIDELSAQLSIVHAFISRTYPVAQRVASLAMEPSKTMTKLEDIEAALMLLVERVEKNPAEELVKTLSLEVQGLREQVSQTRAENTRLLNEKAVIRDFAKLIKQA